MAQSKEFVDASHALNDLSRALALLESENASLRGAADGLCNENAKLRELVRFMWLADYAGHFSTLPELQEHQAVVWQRMRELGVEV